MESTPLLNCPFCGFVCVCYKWQMSEYWTVTCTNNDCHCSFSFQNVFKTKKKAIEFWNTRK